MKNVKDIYFTLSVINNLEGHVVLVLKNNNKDYIFYAQNENETIERLKEDNPQEINSIYISNSVDQQFINNLIKTTNATIYVSPNNNLELSNVIFANEFIYYQNITKPYKDALSLCGNNKYFKECFDNLSLKYKSNVKALKKLEELEMIKYNNDEIMLTENGQIVFSNTNCEIIIKDSSVYNSLYFSTEKNFKSPLFSLAQEVTNYLINIIPNVQERSNTHSKIFKLLDSKIVNKIIMFCICFNNFQKNRKIEIELTNYSLNICLLETDSFIIKKFFEHYYNEKISYNELYNACKQKQVSIDFSKSNKGKIKLNIFLSKNISEMDDDLDNLDYEIILFAKNNSNFTRKMIDQIFNISPRNSNLRIKKMIDKNILKCDGFSRAIRYNYNSDSEQLNS